jgi:UDP-glucose 4-epimerase
MSEPDETKSIDTVIAALESQFPSVGRPEIAKVVGQRYHEFDGAPVRDYIPVLVQRGAREQLLDMSGAQRPRY